MEAFRGRAGAGTRCPSIGPSSPRADRARNTHGPAPPVKTPGGRGLLHRSTIHASLACRPSRMSVSTPSSLPHAIPSAVFRDRERHFWASVVALGVGGFAIGTGEFVIMGLLPEVARGVGVTIPQAGHVISAYALGVVIGAPVLAVLGANWPRRALLIALMALFALGNFASA